MMKSFKLGADPEFFLTKDNKIVSAEGIVGGSKWEPVKFDDAGFYMQEDNVMVEFNIPPSSTKQEFIDNIEFAKEYLTLYLQAKGYGVSYTTTAEFDKETLSTEQAKVFGCDPDYNVYTQSRNRPPKGDKMTQRFCGGHIHIGIETEYPDELLNLVKALDITLALPAVLLDPDSHRKKVYGKAGNYRIKSYGVEYRTPSNFWLNSVDSIGWVYDKVVEAVNLMDYIYDFEHLQQDVVNAINSNDKQVAAELLVVITKQKQLIKT